MAVLPAEIPTGLVTGHYYFVNEDNIDADTDPELTVVTGTVRFIASVKTLRMPSKKAVLVPLTFDGVFDSQGNLTPLNGTGIGMELPATNSPLFSEQDYTWRVEFNLKEAGTTNTVNLDSFDIQVPVGSTQDLSELIPVSSTTGVLTLRGPKGDDGPAGTVSDASVAAALEQPLTKAALSGTIDASIEPIESSTALRGSWKLADLIVSQFNSASVTIAGGALSGSQATPGGRAWIPCWGKAFRASGTLRASKADTGSVTSLGVSYTALGVDPGVTGSWCGIAYVQGVGVVLRRSSDTAGQVILVADSALTDGQDVPFSITWDGQIHSTGVPAEWTIQAQIFNTAGAQIARGQFYQNWAWGTGYGSIVMRTNTAAGVKAVAISQSLGGGIDQQTYGQNVGYSATFPTEKYAFRTPKKPNGKLVIACHGRGQNNISVSDAAQYNNTWQQLLNAGYTLAFPNSLGNYWGNADVQTLLREIRDTLCAALNLDRKPYLWGYSMGGGAALTAIGRNTFEEGVAAAYLAAPVCDLAAARAANSGFVELDTIYPTTAAMDAYSPIKQPTENYAGTPLLFAASPSDAVVTKAAHTDAMRAKLGTVTTHALLTGAGSHDDVSLFQADACLSWFQTYGE